MGRVRRYKSNPEYQRQMRKFEREKQRLANQMSIRKDLYLDPHGYISPKYLHDEQLDC